MDTAAQVSVINNSLFEHIVPRSKSQDQIILKGADTFEARLVEQIRIQIGITAINWNMVVANITDNRLQRAVIDLSDYSIRLNGQNII